MASKTAAISVNVIADAAKFKAGLKDAEAAAGSFDNQMKNMAKGVAAAMGTAALIRFGQEAVKASLEDAAAQVELQRQLEASTGATADQVAQVEEFINKTQNATGVLDDQLRPAFATLTRFTQDATESQRLLSIALDVSTATGKPLEAVSLALGRAYGGSTTALQKLGIQTKDASGEALSFDKIQQNLVKTFGGATQKAAQTTAGKIKIAQASFADLQEEIGTALVPALTALVDITKPIIDAFNNLSPKQQQLIVGAIGLTVAFKATSAALVAVGASAKLAQASFLPLLAVTAAVALITRANNDETVDATEVQQAYTDALNRTIGATGNYLLTQFKVLNNQVRNQQSAGLLGDEINSTEQAFRDLAAASPATAKAYLDTANSIEVSEAQHMRLTEILEEETLKLATNTLAVQESSEMVDAAAESLSGYMTQWLTLKGLLSDRVMWDNLDTSFDNLQEKAAAAFGGSEQDVKDFNVAALQAAAEIDKVVTKLDLPEEVQTKISILYDQGKFDQIYGLLRALDPLAVRQAFAAINGPFLPGMASGGTVTSSGMALVGEKGPELLNLPTGASVIPLTGTTGGGGNTINITVTSADPQAVINAIRNFERRNGSGWRN
jgi:hypothetical protein